MITEQWIDRTAWGEGPWQDEPDRAEWYDEATDLACLALRNRMGAWCGYVAVPPGHPLHGADYDAPDLDVHGGLTFAGPCMTDDRPRRQQVCHVPRPGEPGDVWWFGFDCAHYCDYVPSMGEIFDREDYRPLGYVRQQCTALAAQLAAR